MTKRTDIELIESVKKGNTSDYAELINKYKDKAFSLLKRMLKNEQDAEEVLQDCFLKAYNALDSFQYNSKFSTWFYRIVYNTACTVISNERRKFEMNFFSTTNDDNEEIEYPDQSFDNNITETKELNELLLEMIRNLPPKYGAVLNMFYMEEMTLEEIGKITGLSASNVKVTLHRGRNLLKEYIEKKKLKKDII